MTNFFSSDEKGKEGVLSDEQELLLMRSFDNECSEAERLQAEEILREHKCAGEMFSDWRSLREAAVDKLSRCEEECAESRSFHSQNSSQSQNSSSFQNTLESRVMARIEQELHLQKIYGQLPREHSEGRRGFFSSLQNFIQEFRDSIHFAPQAVGAGFAVALVALGVYWSQGASYPQGSSLSASGLSETSAREPVFSVALQQSLAEREGNIPQGRESAPFLFGTPTSALIGSQGNSSIHPVSGSNLASSLGTLDAPMGMSFAPRFQSEEHPSNFSSRMHPVRNMTPSMNSFENVDEVELEWVRSDGRVQIVSGARSGGPVLFVRRPRLSSEAEIGMSVPNRGMLSATARAQGTSSMLSPSQQSKPALFSSEGDPNRP